MLFACIYVQPAQKVMEMCWSHVKRATKMHIVSLPTCILSASKVGFSCWPHVFNIKLKALLSRTCVVM